ncbi:uncharacterized protein MEPE_01720 [Melanopsichium pennsylvanicum]|uniref:Yeast cell wall synthesis Kre9/Knh1-like N-terminal domain-containing protein n=2 Tax=Melanopsichium pennsylvanicum TaxID=63383 RepID=A0AAJ4XIJ3_9BASI|nr:conserved hypothetical protein [Melanopsichium pennsylvanicum 4]SNX83014.1 uncharacterized protein MEPE_01720 [Melanopsichium pennsylvanicum]
MVSIKITTLALLGLAAADTVISTIVVTKPVASTTAHGGKRLSVEWKDDGDSPTRRDWGRVNIYLATGSRDVQYKLDTIASNISYNANSANYTVDASVGPSGEYYFIRFEGTNSSQAGGNPPMAFSARFSLDQMSGSFNSTIMSQLSGVSGTGQLTTASASATSTASSFSSLTSSKSTTSSTSAASSRSTSVRSTSDAASTKLTGYASALVGLAAMGVAFL